MHRARRHYPETDVREMHRAATFDDPAWSRKSATAAAPVEA